MLYCYYKRCYMEKSEILRCHENYIRNTYAELYDRQQEDVEFDKKIASLYPKLQKDQNLSAFYHAFALLLRDKSLNKIKMIDVRESLVWERAMIFHELGFLNREERTKINQGTTNWIEEDDNIEYKLRLLELASMQDTDSKKYRDLVNYLYALKNEGATLKTYQK